MASLGGAGTRLAVFVCGLSLHYLALVQYNMIPHQCHAGPWEHLCRTVAAWTVVWSSLHCAFSAALSLSWQSSPVWCSWYTQRRTWRNMMDFVWVFVCFPLHLLAVSQYAPLDLNYSSVAGMVMLIAACLNINFVLVWSGTVTALAPTSVYVAWLAYSRANLDQLSLLPFLLQATQTLGVIFLTGVSTQLTMRSEHVITRAGHEGLDSSVYGGRPSTGIMSWMQTLDVLEVKAMLWMRRRNNLQLLPALAFTPYLGYIFWRIGTSMVFHGDSSALSTFCPGDVALSLVAMVVVARLDISELLQKHMERHPLQAHKAAACVAGQEEKRLSHSHLDVALSDYLPKVAVDTDTTADLLLALLAGLGDDPPRLPSLKDVIVAQAAVLSGQDLYNPLSASINTALSALLNADESAALMSTLGLHQGPIESLVEAVEDCDYPGIAEGDVQSVRDALSLLLMDQDLLDRPTNSGPLRMSNQSSAHDLGSVIPPCVMNPTHAHSFDVAVVRTARSDFTSCSNVASVVACMLASEPACVPQHVSSSLTLFAALRTQRLSVEELLKQARGARDLPGSGSLALSRMTTTNCSSSSSLSRNQSALSKGCSQPMCDPHEHRAVPSVPDCVHTSTQAAMWPAHALDFTPQLPSHTQSHSKGSVTTPYSVCFDLDSVPVKSPFSFGPGHAEDGPASKKLCHSSLGEFAPIPENGSAAEDVVLEGRTARLTPARRHSCLPMMAMDSPFGPTIPPQMASLFSAPEPAPLLAGGKQPRASIFTFAPVGAHTVSATGRLAPPSPIIANPSRLLLDQMEQVLSQVDNNWHFDCFNLCEASQGRPLSTLCFYLVHTQGLIASCSLDTVKLVRFLRRIEDGYKPNPYHNKTHAAHVLHRVHVLLHAGGFVPGYVDPLTKLALYLAAAVHDYEHLGYTNDFLIQTQDPLATLYNDRSPMENHHCAATMALLRQPGFDFIKLPRPDFDRLRKMVIDLVLATDMKQHFSIVTLFSNMHRSAFQLPPIPTILPGPTRKSSGDMVILGLEDQFSELGNAFSTLKREVIQAESQTLHPTDEHERMCSLQMVLKAADISHLGDPLQMHRKWLAGLEEEFFLQGDAELARGMPISPLFDRQKPGVASSQVSFVDVIAIPMYRALRFAFPGTRPLLLSVLDNHKCWLAQEESTKVQQLVLTVAVK